MAVDERARSARQALLRDLEAMPVPRPAAVVRRVRARRRARTLVIGVVVALSLLPLALAGRSTRHDGLKVTGEGTFSKLPRGSEVSGAWASIPKSGAGLHGTTDISSITSTGSALIAGGRGLWRSTDGIRWESVEPAGLSGRLTALGAHGPGLVGVAGSAGAMQLLMSSDDGQTWSVTRAADFGTPATSMGRPFVTSLLWSESAQAWIAGGGGSDGHAAVWMSPDGRSWRSVLPTNGADSADVVPDGFGGFFAWWADRVWSSADGGRTWTEDVRSSLPPQTTLNTVAPGGVLAAGIDSAFSASPTPLLRSADRGKTWSADARRTLGLTIVRGFSHDNGVWAAEGHLSSDDSPAAWISTDSVTWTGLPPTLKPPGKGSLTRSATIGSTTVFLSEESRLDRFFVVNATWAGLDVTSSCPGSVSRRLVDGRVAEGGDALPNIENAQTNRAAVEAALSRHEPELARKYPGMSRAEVGSGFGVAWQGENGGQYQLVLVQDYAVIVHLPARSACPPAEDLRNALPDAPLFLVVDR
jgi:hypothetical protein